MPTTRGFVQEIEIGRGGLVRVSVVEDDATSSVFTITDIDGDPERFNERLSKLAVLRDAMNRAEPVEIEHSSGEGGDEIDRATRISRDALSPPGTVDQVAGLVVDVTVNAVNRTGSVGERHDHARISVFTVQGGSVDLLLDLQAPERLVARGQLEMVRDAQAAGWLARFTVSTGDDDTVPRVLGVAVDDDLSGFGDDKDQALVSGFVESLGVMGPAGGAPPGLATARFTTAPDLSSPGNTIDPAAFTPTELTLYLAKGSVHYDLVEAGLRDNVRMRLGLAPLQSAPPEEEERPALVRSSRSSRRTTGDSGADAVTAAPAALVLAAELQAPLASASRPVWVHVDRTMLDKGPAEDCTVGVPSSDLTPRGLRDLRIPYPAKWRGLGCFNRGVYRFQVTLAGSYTVLVDGVELCLFDTETPDVKVGYACMEGDHWLILEVDEWTCDSDFQLDAYRIR